ncbi:hypothetical protein TNCV_3857061 [Trichonephila clavipes]|nr:hypothetical protein TNCV_3857061 [Trichonephila clavipes]
MLDGCTPPHVFEIGSVADVSSSSRQMSRERRYSLYGLDSQVSRLQPYRVCLGRFGKGNCNSQSLSENHPGNESSVVERVGLITTLELINYLISKKKADAILVALCVYALESIMILLTKDAWLHFYTDGSAQDHGSAGAGIYCEKLFEGFGAKTLLQR